MSVNEDVQDWLELLFWFDKVVNRSFRFSNLRSIFSVNVSTVLYIFSVVCSSASHCAFKNLTVLGNALQSAHTHASTPYRSFIPTQFVWKHVKYKLHRIHFVLTSLKHYSIHKISSSSELHDLLVSCDACFPVLAFVLSLSLFVD